MYIFSNLAISFQFCASNTPMYWFDSNPAWVSKKTPAVIKLAKNKKKYLSWNEKSLLHWMFTLSCILTFAYSCIRWYHIHQVRKWRKESNCAFYFAWLRILLSRLQEKRPWTISFMWLSVLIGANFLLFGSQLFYRLTQTSNVYYLAVS